jgi:hypothetical protein
MEVLYKYRILMCSSDAKKSYIMWVVSLLFIDPFYNLLDILHKIGESGLKEPVF